ncbi:AEC family transporter [Vibrio sp. SCSIO 43137]|uniref:AEC family transporter n=1 Tax=Vibrio sp. SCSIO 43137 TaxID=3021011 RepID=UPI0023071D46|nr:AEC family transporter [Vibrio sp. SCSIO 43137]WCE32259.1 AEC family transporter [Vibrio sp. SCSIO 43137]
MSDFLSQLQFSASITGPICLMLLLGVVLKKISLINDEFIDIASKLVFQITLPALLFLSIVRSEHDFTSSAPLILFGLIANLLFFISVFWISRRWFKVARDRGVIIQGSYRANTAIIALAYVANAYGDSGIALAAVYVAPMTLLYNVLAVIALSQSSEANTQGAAHAIKVIVKTLTRNPLIIAILIGLIFYALSIPVPEMVLDAGQYFANMTLPLALLCTGGSLNIRSLRGDKYAMWFATSNKLLIAPLLITGAALFGGFRGMELGLIFFMSAAPTAAASYVMARTMGGNSSLAANIIALTTVASLITCTVGIFILSSLSLM